MSLPAQIQKQIDDARALSAQLSDGNAGADGAKDGGDTAVLDGEAPATPSAAPVSATEVMQPAANTATPSDEDENSGTYAQRWRTLQGRYNALLRHSEATTNRLSGLEQLVAQMQTAPAPREASATPASSKFLTDKDETEYGQDMVDFTKRAAREEVAPLAQAVRALVDRFDQLSTVVPVVNSVAQRQGATEREQFLQRLTARVPDLAELNDDPDVHTWLLQIDPFTGISRQTYLQDAEKNLDFGRVVSIFEGARMALGKANPAASGSASAPLAPASSAAQRLERQVAPGRASAATPAPRERTGKQWTRTDIQSFYADRMKGKYKGKEAEATKLEQDIFTAQREGRISG